MLPLNWAADKRRKVDRCVQVCGSVVLLERVLRGNFVLAFGLGCQGDVDENDPVAVDEIQAFIVVVDGDQVFAKAGCHFDCEGEEAGGVWLGFDDSAIDEMDASLN